jgi:hypothetical protein
MYLMHKFNNRRAKTKKTNSMAKLFYCQPELVEGGLNAGIFSNTFHHSKKHS